MEERKRENQLQEYGRQEEGRVIGRGELARRGTVSRLRKSWSAEPRLMFEAIWQAKGLSASTKEIFIIKIG